MKLVHVALALEARPFIDHWGMRKAEASRLGAVYLDRTGTRMLVVSGTGPLAAAAAVSAALVREPSVDLALNVGLAGCPGPEVACGEPRLINRIVDAGSGRSYHPDVLYRHPWEEAALTTHAAPVTAATAPGTLVDMEGAGFFVAAAARLPAHRIGLLKVVSDHLEGRALDRAAATGWIANQVESVEAVLEGWAVGPERLPALPVELVERVMALGQAWRLTATQCHQLRAAVEGAFHRGRTDWTVLNPKPLVDANTRSRNAALKGLIHALAAEV